MPTQIDQVLSRARQAIAQARRLTARAAEPSEDADALPATRMLQTTVEPSGTVRPQVENLAERLVDLQTQQARTLEQLVHVRTDQLRLRQQQLSALRSILLIVNDTPHRQASQDDAVQRTANILTQSVDEIRAITSALRSAEYVEASAQDVRAIAVDVSNLDARARVVSASARSLLQVLQRARALASPEQLHKGLEVAARLQSFPCEEGSALLGEQCCICLGPYELLSSLSLLPCAHSFHSECIKEWLYVSSSCPLCKHDLQWCL